MDISSEILINASLVTYQGFGDSYEFVLNTDLQVVECVKVESLLHGIISPVIDPSNKLESLLFELNHVRVNPNADNTKIINCLTNALKDIGVNVNNAPSQDSIGMTFKPLGEISDNVRFYLDHSGKMIFLSPAIKPRLVVAEGKPLPPTKD